MKAGDLLQAFKVVVGEEEVDDNEWLKEEAEWEKKLGKEFLAYHKSHVSQVIHIKELRKQDDGRSSLWIRMTRPEKLDIEPACNISIYPKNVRKNGE